jgi:acetyl-CoA C-acetyltransferase
MHSCGKMNLMKSLKSVFAKPIYLGAATRSPIGRFGGSLLAYSAPTLAAEVLKEGMRRAPEVGAVDWVALGHARQAGAGPNSARQAGVAAGLSLTVPAITE